MIYTCTSKDLYDLSLVHNNHNIMRCNWKSINKPAQTQHKNNQVLFLCCVCAGLIVNGLPVATHNNYCYYCEPGLSSVSWS